MATPATPVLSPQQLATLAEHGEERTAEAGETLFKVGDPSYQFIAILEGEVAVVDAAEPRSSAIRRPGSSARWACSPARWSSWARLPRSRCAGALDQDPGIRPGAHQFVDYAAPWEPLPDDGLPRFPERMQWDEKTLPGQD